MKLLGTVQGLWDDAMAWRTRAGSLLIGWFTGSPSGDAVESRKNGLAVHAGGREYAPLALALGAPAEAYDVLANAQSAAALLRENGVRVPTLRLRASHVGSAAELTRYVRDAERDVLTRDTPASIARLRFLRSLTPGTRRANPSAGIPAIARKLLERRIEALASGSPREERAAAALHKLGAAEREKLYASAAETWADDLETVLTVPTGAAAQSPEGVAA
ncbi:MAG: hypothetical protein ACI82G_000913, partial [Bradymonadia bacterium]